MISLERSRWIKAGAVLAASLLALLAWQGGARPSLEERVVLAKPAPSAGATRLASGTPSESAWGPSPFARGPVRESPQRAPPPAPQPDQAPAAVPSEFDARVHLFELLRSRAEHDAALDYVAREIERHIEPALLAGEISETEALLLTGAVLEILEPDNDTRAALLDEWGRLHLPPAEVEEEAQG